jgi:hypothetical protein
MRTTTLAALAGLTLAGGALAGCASDPYYNDYAWNRPDPYYADAYYGPVYRPGYVYAPGSIGASVLGGLLGGAYDYGTVPADRYGPNPDGMIAADGHRIRCTLRSRYDSRYGARVMRRECR